MILESKPLSATVLKETYVLLLGASALYYAVKLYQTYGADCPGRLIEMFEERLETVKLNVSDIVHPHPF